jgi:hypothetical protein
LTSVLGNLQVGGWAIRVLHIDDGVYADFGRVFVVRIKRCLKARKEENVREANLELGTTIPVALLL